MEVGQPGTPAPRAALEAVKRALDRETLGYTVALGLPALRERIALHYRQRYGVTVAPERVVVTTGRPQVSCWRFWLFDAGAQVALPSPGYPCYRHILTALGQTPIPLVTDAGGRWMPTAAQIDEVARRDRIAGLVIASPANPTGTMLEPGRLAEIAHACKRHRLWFVSDEIYHGLTYGMAEQTALAHSDEAVVINSFSKYFSMTGWRVGWLVVPEALVRPIERLAQNLYISPPTVAQVAAIGAFDELEELEANKRATPRIARSCSRPFPRPGSTASFRRRRLLPVCRCRRSDRGQRRPPKRCSRTSASPPRPASTSTPSAGAAVRFCYAGTTADMAEAARRSQAGAVSEADMRERWSLERYLQACARALHS